MSAREFKRRHRGRALKAAKRAAKAQGCTCSVEATGVGRQGTVPFVALAHDDHCALLRSVDTACGGGFTQLVVDLDTGDAA